MDPDPGVLLTHRVCVPEHAAWVERACRHDRRVLPRWHQDDRGATNVSRGVHQVAPAGAYAHVPAWHGREHWLTVVVPTALKIHEAQLHRVVSPGLLRRYLAVASGYAQDARTGRRCIVRPDTLASVLGVSKRAVQLCRRVARAIGLEVVIRTGRMLTVHECLAARRRGSCQRGFSTEVAFTNPASIPANLWIFTPTRGNPPSRQSHLTTTHLGSKTAARGEMSAAASPRQPRRKRRRCAEGHQLGLQLTRKVAWLGTERPGRLAPTLQRFAVAGWDADGVLIKLREVATRHGHIFEHLTTQQIRTRPAILLAALLRDLDPQADHPAPPDLTPTTPCTRDDCVHGWIDLDDGTAAKCPDCRPSNRAPQREAHPTALGWDQDEPPF